jgi:cyclic pyranopterin phosphate synthase
MVAPAMSLHDRHRRPLGTLRLSVTDRCNVRCQYCMPEQEYVWLPRTSLLSFEEIDRLAGLFHGEGVRRLRLTGGEPLLRRDLPALVDRLAAGARFDDLALTTNGVLLADQAGALRAAGLRRVTVSLDTLRRDRFQQLTRFDRLPDVLRGIEAACAAGFPPPKIDTVVMRDLNDDELVPLLEFGRSIGAEVRFIEYMDVGGATRWSPHTVVPRTEILQRLEGHYGPLVALPGDAAAPAARFALPDGTAFGVISSTTEPFCGTCDRLRLTADGLLLLCLYATTGIDLRTLLRGGADDEALRETIRGAWEGRTNRGAEDRLRERTAAPFVSPDELAKDVHLEMHTRGG